jgi:hypothetical protein
LRGIREPKRLCERWKREGEGRDSDDDDDVDDGDDTEKVGRDFSNL